MKKPYIVIAPSSRKLRNGKNNPKNYPFFKELIALLEKDYDIIQVSSVGEEALVPNTHFNCSLDHIKELLKGCALWVSVDSFLQHLAHHVGKKGVVLWGPSDPRIFGYPNNVNILKDKKYLRIKPFDIWEAIEFNAEAFVPPATVYSVISTEFPLQSE